MSLNIPLSKKSLASKYNSTITPLYEQKAEELSPFELKNQLIQLASKGSPDYLNAGRGNPDFYNTIGRLALCKLIQFGVAISEQEIEHSLGYRPDNKDILTKFKRYFEDDTSKETLFLKEAVNLALSICSDKITPAGDILYELCDAALGDFYPDPPRILPNVEKIVNKYLEMVLLKGNSKGKFDLFATEGATAGMVYVFKSLQENFLLNKRDKVAIITPVFSPYLEIPQLNDFEFEIIYLDTSEDQGWMLSDKEIEKLKDQSIKVLYLINPTNPTSVALSDESINKIAEVVNNNNKNLIILVDAVYATFSDSYTSIINKLSQNCITVYSYSKYFGVTGWRLGAVMINEDNIMDKLISSFPSQWKELLADRYKIDSETPDDVKFIDRILWDSRDVALAHTGGISGPQQVSMALFALFDILDQNNSAGDYRKHIKDILKKRMSDLSAPLKMEVPVTKHHTYYYSLIDILDLAIKNYDEGQFFAKYLLKNYYPVDFVFCLALVTHSVCLPGYGFFEAEKIDDSEITHQDRNNWSIRVSLANLATSHYTPLGKNIKHVLDLYYQEYKPVKK